MHPGLGVCALCKSNIRDRSKGPLILIPWYDDAEDEYVEGVFVGLHGNCYHLAEEMAGLSEEYYDD